MSLSPNQNWAMLAPNHWTNKLKKVKSAWTAIKFGSVESCRSARDNLRKRYPEFEYKVEALAGGVLYARIKQDSEGGDHAA